MKLEQSPRDKEANNLIRAIREERGRRRATPLAKAFHPPPREQHIWDNMGNGPYAAYDLETELCAVDVLGLMYDLSFHAVHPGGEAKVLNEVDKELKRMATEREYEASGPHLQMLVAMAHRIITAMEQLGELRKVRINEGQA